MLEIGWVVIWYLASFILGLLAFPIVFYVCTQFNDRGYAISRVVALIIVGFITWLLRIPKVSVGLSWTLALILLAGIAGWLAYSSKEFQKFVKEHWKQLAWLELTFFIALVVFSFIRTLTPAISGGEKFMDFGMFNAAQRTEVLPIQDFWMSGTPLRYYWFGHLLVGMFSKTVGTPPPVGYNLSMALLFAMTVMIAFSIGLALTKKWRWAIWAVAFIAIFGNLAGAVQIIKVPWEKYDFWSPTRVIDGKIAGTINEFPFFTFFFADLHAHVIAIPIVLAIIYLFLQIFREGPNVKNCGLSILLLGCLRVTNAWDWPALAALLGLLLVARWWQSGRSQSLLKCVIIPWVIVTGGSFALFLGWPQPQPLSIKMATIHSKIGEWMLTFGAFFFIIAAFILSNFRWVGWGLLAVLIAGMFFMPVWVWLLLFVALLIVIYFRRKGDHDLSFGIILTLTGTFILIGIELIYLHDWLANSWQRMNTVFKFGLHAWYLLSMAMPVLIAAAWHNTEKKKFVLMGLLTLLVIAGLVYPTVVLAQRIKWNPPYTLYGWTELQQLHFGDWNGIHWLSQQKGNPIVLEAGGDAYQYVSRVSAHTGLPTVVGWAGHLFQHGASWDDIFSRRNDVHEIYNSTTMDIALPLIKKYNVTYVFVGEVEHQKYSEEGLSKFKTLPIAFEARDVVIYSVT